MITSRARAWSLQDICLLGLMLGVGVWSFTAPLLDMLRVGMRDEEQSHILLGPFVILWLVWLRKARLPLIMVRPSLIGCAVVVSGCVLSWIGFQTDTYIAWHAGALVVLLGMLLSLTGLEPLRQFGPAAFALLFLLPVPGTIRQSIAIPLQSMATEVTFHCLELFGVQAARMGNVLLVNGEQIAVAEACNGMRLVFSLTLVVYAFAFSVPLRPSMRLLLIAASPIVALLANVIRLVPTSLLYGTMSADHAETFHDVSGWLMLPIALIALLLMVKLFKWLEFPVFSYRLASP